MKKTAKILLALCACMVIGGNAAMAQDRMAESAATVKTLYGTENPCAIKGSPYLQRCEQQGTDAAGAEGAFNFGGAYRQRYTGGHRHPR